MFRERGSCAFGEALEPAEWCGTVDGVDNSADNECGYNCADTDAAERAEKDEGAD